MRELYKIVIEFASKEQKNLVFQIEEFLELPAIVGALGLLAVHTERKTIKFVKVYEYNAIAKSWQLYQDEYFFNSIEKIERIFKLSNL
jgi:hypothetical protein